VSKNPVKLRLASQETRGYNKGSLESQIRGRRVMKRYLFLVTVLIVGGALIVQIREISGGSGFASQDSLLAEFGLGEGDEPVDVTVRWPSGVQSSLAGVAVDQIVTLIEPWLVYLPVVVRNGS